MSILTSGARVVKVSKKTITKLIFAPLVSRDNFINVFYSNFARLEFLKPPQKRTENVPVEPEMLRAVAKSKDVCSQYMTEAAIVVRGLPVKLI